MGTELQTPVFPLHAVLFPGGTLPLRIFEPRYMDMLCRCLRKGEGFGVSLIREGNEVGDVATPYEIGTLVQIRDWHRDGNGMLGIEVQGTQRFQIHETWVEADRLLVAKVRALPDVPATPVPRRFQGMVELLRELLDKSTFDEASQRFDDAEWISCRLAELLPLPLAQKQYLLQLGDPVQRLERICAMARALSDEP